MVTITHPDGTKTVQKSFNFNNPPEGDPNKYRDGAIKEEQSIDAASHVLKGTTFIWEPGPDGAPRLQSTRTVDELGQALVKSYDSYGNDNSIGRVRTTTTNQRPILPGPSFAHKKYLVSYVDNDLDSGISFSSGGRVVRWLINSDIAKVYEEMTI